MLPEEDTLAVLERLARTDRLLALSGRLEYYLS